MEGAIELAEEVFHMPVRLGVPQYVEGLSDVVRNPIHATGVGLLLYSKQVMQQRAENGASKNGVHSAFGRMKAWFQKNF
jgi:cell division protein FtsA